MNRRIISEILTGYWSINRQWADAHLPLIIALLNGSTAVSFVQRDGSAETEMPFVVDPSTMNRSEMYAFDSNRGRYVPNPNIAPGSVGIIPMTGPLSYYNGDCGEPGMIERTNWLMEMKQRENIGSIVQLMDTPGGMSTAATHYVAEMQKSKKPILSYVDHMCGSLGMWPAAQSDEVYLSNDFAEMGSVGSYCMLIDPSGAYEKAGLKVIQVYAPQSTDKNKDYLDAIAGNDALIKKDLAKHVDAFIGHVMKSGGTARSAKATSNVAEWNSGKMFYAQDAVDRGLANGIKSFSQVVSKAAWLAKRNK
jgi:protease IV